MGYIDLKINVTRGAIWKTRALRLQSLKNSTKSPENNEASTLFNCNNTNLDECENRMDLDLYLAARTGDVDALIDVLKQVSAQKNVQPSDLLDQVSPAGNTLLHLCVIYGNKEGAAFLAFHFLTLLPRPNSQGDTAMHLAARADDTEIVETLIGIWNDHQPPPDRSSGDFNISPFLEQLPVQPLTADDWSGSLLGLKNKEGNTLLHESLIQGYGKGMSHFLISSDTKVLHFLNDKGESPLYLSSKAGEAELVETILIHDIESTDGRLKGKSPIHAVIRKRGRGVLEILLAREPRFILLTDEEGRTPLHLAASLGHLKEVKYLLGINSDSIFSMDNTGLLPIHLANI